MIRLCSVLLICWKTSQKWGRATKFTHFYTWTCESHQFDVWVPVAVISTKEASLWHNLCIIIVPTFRSFINTMFTENPRESRRPLPDRDRSHIVCKEHVSAWSFQKVGKFTQTTARPVPTCEVTTTFDDLAIMFLLPKISGGRTREKSRGRGISDSAVYNRFYFECRSRATSADRRSENPEQLITLIVSCGWQWWQSLWSKLYLPGFTLWSKLYLPGFTLWSTPRLH